MLVTKSNHHKIGLRKRTINREVKIGPLSLQFISIIILALLALLYLAQSTQGATKNYKIRELDIQKDQLKENNERLEVESIRLKSLNEIKDQIKDMGLESNKEVNYLPSEQPLVKR